jgi:hypothetical protein
MMRLNTAAATAKKKQQQGVGWGPFASFLCLL